MRQAWSIDRVETTIENIQTKDWVIWSYQHVYTKGEPAPGVQEFLDYLVSDEVQQGVVQDLGYVAITDMKVERSATGEVTNK